MHNGCGGAAAYGKEGEKDFAFGEDRRHLGNVSKNFVFCFAFLSVCTTLLVAKIGCTSESKINHDLFCASLGLHDLCPHDCDSQ